MVDAGRYSGLLCDLEARPVGRGWDARCPCVTRHRHGDRSPSLRLWIGDKGELVARCFGCGATWDDILSATRTRKADWFPGDSYDRRRRKCKVVETYDYFNDAGEFIAQKMRKEPGPNGAKKTFAWRRPLTLAAREQLGLGPTEEAWAYGLDAGWYAPGDDGNRRSLRLADSNTPHAVDLPKVSPGLYRLPELQAAAFEEPVVFVEGERKANALAAIGFKATSGPSGARAWDCRLAEAFRERKVIVFPDNNPPGLMHATTVAGTLLWCGAAGVKLIIPGERWDVKDNEDIGDWLRQFKPQQQRRAVFELLARFPSYLSGGGSSAPQAA